MKFSTAVRNARADAVEATMGNGGFNITGFYSGSGPASCDSAPTGTALGYATLPADWMAAASGGVKAKTGTWAGQGIASGTIGYARLGVSGDWPTSGTWYIQVSVSMPGGGGELIVDNTNVANGQPITVLGFTWTEGNQ